MLQVVRDRGGKVQGLEEMCQQVQVPFSHLLTELTSDASLRGDDLAQQLPALDSASAFIYLFSV